MPGKAPVHLAFYFKGQQVAWHRQLGQFGEAAVFRQAAAAIQMRFQNAPDTLRATRYITLSVMVCA